MVVSLAMLGLGASGLLVSLWPARFRPERAPQQLAACASLFAVSAVLAVGVAFRVPISLEETPGNWLRVGAVFGLATVPFLAGGLVVALILTHHAAAANRLYGFDLTGAALGCVAFIPATNWLGAPTAILGAAAAAAAAGAILAGRAARVPGRVAGLLACALVLSAAANTGSGFYDVRVTKGKRQPPMLALEWNSFSRVEVLGRPADLKTPRQPFSAGLSTTLDPDFRVAEVWLRYDADAATQITRLDGDPTRLTHLAYDVTSAPYHLRRYGNVLVIGPGGGRDVLTALALGSGPVTGVEINPMTIRLMRDRFRAFTGGLYDGFPGVEVVNDDGRSFIRHAAARYDLIQASLVDTWAASAAGAHALSENSLYTVEAFEDYLRHLTPDGVLAISRWFDPPAESLRVVTLAREALRRQGVVDPAAHVLVARTDPTKTQLPALGTILVKRSPFTAIEVAALRAWAERMRFPVSYAPDDLARGGSPADFHRLLGIDAERFIATYPYDISAVHDDRPFFFNRVPLVPWLLHRFGLPAPPPGRAPLTLGGQTLLIALTGTGASTVALLALPLLAARRRRRDPSGPARAGHGPRGAALWGCYFAAVGLGFIMVEIVLIQRFGLVLGYPVYALSVVLVTMLATSGLGSLLAGRGSPVSLLPRALGVLAAALLLYAVGLPWLHDALLGTETAVRILVVAAAVAPLGLLMGMPFPTALRWAGTEAGGLVPWAWAVNGGASVFGSALAVLVSMTWGFTATLLAGALAYGAALAVVLWLAGDCGPTPAPKRARS
jgi:SAM-dependent methyltransferase